MATYFLWGSIALIVIVLLIGFFTGFGRGVKRSSTHVLFVVASIIIAFFITKPITDSIMNINIQVDGATMAIEDYILKLISDNLIDLSNFDSASSFIQGLPTAVANPIIFLVIMLLVYFVMDIIYLIVARVSFGRRSKDFETHKPHRVSGGVIGMIEAFFFMIVLFAPITSLTNTYSEIVEVSVTTSQNETTSQSGGEYLLTLGETLGQNLPSEVTEAIDAFNNSAIGKICSLGGFDDAMFDGLSNFDVNGEDICVRQELISLTDTYDYFVRYYNEAFIDGNYDVGQAKTYFNSLKDALTSVIENNIFKAVIADTIGDIVVNFDTIEINGQPIKDQFPQIAQDLIGALQDEFSTENFDAYSYLSNDLLKILDIAEDFISNGSITKITKIDTENISSILNYVVGDNVILSTSLQSFVGLNVVSDTLPILLDFANEQIAPMFENDKGLVVALNSDITITELQSVISTLLEGQNSIVSQVKSINDKYDVISLLNSDDILNDILNMPGIAEDGASEVLTSLGGLIDDVNELPLFTYETTGGVVKAFDNILIINGIDVLGDTVTENGEQVTLDTYEEVFSYLGEPIDLIISSGLTDLLNSEVDFNAILDIMTENISGTAEEGDENYNFLVDILMPFYELDEMSVNGQTIKELVFDTVVNMLRENLSDYIDLPETTADKATWEEALVSVAELIDSLNKGEMEVEGQETTQTYLEYLFSGNADYLELIRTMNTDGTVSELLNIIFGNEMYEPLNSQVFSMLDTEITNFTTVPISTSYEDVYVDEDVRTMFVNTISSLISALDEASLGSEDLQTQLNAVGEILDALKTSAENGVFREIFSSIIWYMTGDIVDTENASSYPSEKPFEYTDKVKEYFGVSDVSEYYTINYANEMNNLVSVLEFSNDLMTNLGTVDLSSPEGISDFISGLETTVENLGDNAETVIETAQQKIASSVLDEDDLSAIKNNSEQIVTAIEEYTSDVLTDSIKDALLDLFGIGGTSEAEVGI